MWSTLCWPPVLPRKFPGTHLKQCRPASQVNKRHSPQCSIESKTFGSGAPSKRTVLLHNIDILQAKKGARLYNDTWDTRLRAAIRVGDYELITGDPGNGSWVPPLDGHWHPVPDNHDSADKNVWLFNIDADPNAHSDLSDKKPDIVLTLLQLLTEFNSTAVPPHFPPLDPQSNPALHDGVWGP